MGFQYCGYDDDGEYDDDGDVSIHCSAHPGWDKKRDDDGFCFISCFLFKAQARSLFHRDLFILS